MNKPLNNFRLVLQAFHMNIYRDIERLPAFENAVITIGTFDGVHNGHRQLIRQLISEAANVSGTPVVVTFYPHPRQVIDSGQSPLFLLNTPAEKYDLLHKAGIEHIVEVPFTREFSGQTAQDYISQFLVKRFRPHSIIVGYDHRFGNNREGDYRLLERESEKFGFRVIEIPEHVLKDITISSTRIREALLSGDVETANEYLGYRYFFHAMVIHGEKRGRTVGYHTANLQADHERKLLPGNGVYAVDVDLRGAGIFRGMMNIGYRPTINGNTRSTEVHLFDFEGNLYGHALKIVLKSRLRDEMKFESLDMLREQLRKDEVVARAIS